MFKLWNEENSTLASDIIDIKKEGMKIFENK